jgi:hypothetical protein
MSTVASISRSRARSSATGAVASSSRRDQQRRLLARRVAFLDGAAERGLDDLDPLLELATAVLGFEQARLHLGHLGERRGEALMREPGFLGPVVARRGERVEPCLVDVLLPDRLLAQVARAERVHEEDRRSGDRPAHQKRPAAEREDLRPRAQPHEARLCIGLEEQSSFGQGAVQARPDDRRQR